VGLHGSASTWVFNVVRELMIAAVGDGRVVAVYADDVSHLPDVSEREHLVIKSHHGSDALEDWLKQRGARVILSVRDPRDACLSMSQRFETPLGATVRWLANDCNRMMRLARAGYPLLRYEDRFFDQSETVIRLANMLPAPVTGELALSIFERYETAAVKTFGANLPADRVQMVQQFMMDKVTQIHASHIGDGRSGKWRDLPGAQSVELTKIFTPFLDMFRYPH